MLFEQGSRLTIALPGRWKAARTENAVTLINDRSNGKILMRVHATDNAGCGALRSIHAWPPELNLLAIPGPMHGQDSHETGSVRPFSGHKQRPRQSLTAGCSGAADRSREGHRRRSECGSDRTEATRGASLPRSIGV